MPFKEIAGLVDAFCREHLNDESPLVVLCHQSESYFS